MRSQNMSLAPYTKDACPICGAALKLTEIEPHPSHNELEIHGYSCECCGPVKSLVVIHPVEEEPPLLRMM